MIKQLVEHAIAHLVESPEKISVQIFRDSAKVIVEVKVAADDFKHVIGKDGRIIKSLRAITDALEPHKKNEILVDIAQ